MIHNQKIMSVELQRIDVCDLLIACTVLNETTGGKQWETLHDKLEKMLNDFDEKNGF